MELSIPLISPVSRKYYEYALENNRKHYRAEDIRICMEYICDEIIYEFVSEKHKERWGDYNLHAKLKASKEFINKKVVNKLIEAKIMANTGVHTGEEGNYTEDDIEKAIEAIRNFSLEVFYSYFKINGFKSDKPTWVPTVFSTLPPIYRIRILEKYYNECNNEYFVIDKLSKAYLKGGFKKKARNFLLKCLEKNEIYDYEYYVLMKSLVVIEKDLENLPIANNLEESKNNFNELLLSIEEDERDSFICLVSLILNGKY